MTQEKMMKFATYGPNRGLTLDIGNYSFKDGFCEVPEKEASAAASVLCRYHDVCYAHELEQKAAEYDAAHKAPGAATASQSLSAASASKAAKPEGEGEPEDGGESGQADENGKKAGSANKKPQK